MNPFVNRTPSFVADWKHGMSIALAAITIFPVRIILTLLNCTLAVLVAYAVPLWPRVFESILRWLVRFQLTLLGLWWVRVNGKPAPRNQAPIVVANHSSLIEAAWLLFHTKAATLSAIENSRRPVVGQVAKGLNTMWVDRTQREGITGQITRHAQSLTGPRVLVFPEGTCGNGQALATFRSGAFVAGVPVQPVAVRYYFGWFDPSWCSVGPDFPALILRMMLSWYTDMEITYLPVHEKHHGETPQEYANRVRASIASVLDVPVTEYSFDDIRLAGLARKMGLDPAIGLVEFTKFNREHGGKLTIDVALERLQHYGSHEKHPSLDGFKTLLASA